VPYARAQTKSGNDLIGYDIPSSDVTRSLSRQACIYPDDLRSMPTGSACSNRDRTNRPTMTGVVPRFHKRLVANDLDSSDTKTWSGPSRLGCSTRSIVAAEGRQSATLSISLAASIGMRGRDEDAPFNEREGHGFGAIREPSADGAEDLLTTQAT